jgi:hypothetical protein
MTFKGLILMYAILLLTSVSALNAFSLLVFLGARTFFWFAFNVPFELPGDDLIKYCSINLCRCGDRNRLLVDLLPTFQAKSQAGVTKYL